MQRAAIYARFSTDLQSERSIEDQVALCRDYARREGLTIIETFEDRARSGGSVLGRDGLMAMMDRARAGAIDVVVVEALDRLSRDMEDLAGLHKRLSFAGVQIRAVHEGTVNTVLVGLRGLVGQLYREDNAQKTRRGLAGRVRDGLAGGGITYGYAPVTGQPGRRAIVEEEAATVRRIFADYAAGLTPRDIAGALNREGNRPPRGRAWNASTINGNGQRGSGILRNELYVGRLVWNKVRMIRNPDTGRRVSRPNPEHEWQTADVPDLAIVDRGLFDRAADRKRNNLCIAPGHQQRAKRMLSGLLRCGCCGSGMSVSGKDKSGRVRVRCSAAAESGTCSDPKTFYLETIEAAVLSGLKAELRAPAVMAEYVRAYHEERRQLASIAIADRSRLERRLAKVQREHERIIDRLVEDEADTRMLGARSKALGAEEDAIRLDLARLPARSTIVALHPVVLARYEQQLGNLERSLAAGARAGDLDAVTAIRELIESVTVTRDEGRRGGVVVEIAGRLNALLGEDAYPNGVCELGGLLVARDRYRQDPHFNPVPFRLRSAA